MGTKASRAQDGEVRAKPALLLVLGLVVGLLLGLGAGGGATAASLTKKSVKKIAARVVDSKASGLTVARAATADTAKDAATVGGKSAAQLGVRPFVWTKSSGTVPSGTTLPLGSVPAGSYLVSVQVLDNGSSTRLSCSVMNTPTFTPLVLAGGPAAPGTYASATGAGLATVPTGNALGLVCSGTADLKVSTGIPWQVTLTPVASTTPLAP
jgi:putative alpha-1,2-mannosidase